MLTEPLSSRVRLPKFAARDADVGTVKAPVLAVTAMLPLTVLKPLRVNAPCDVKLNAVLPAGAVAALERFNVTAPVAASVKFTKPPMLFTVTPEAITARARTVEPILALEVKVRLVPVMVSPTPASEMAPLPTVVRLTVVV